MQAQTNHKELLQLILLRQKPKVASQRIVQKVLASQRLKDKYEANTVALLKKEREVVKEVEEVKKTIEKNEKVVKELVQVIKEELSKKLKAKVNITL